MDSLFLIFLGWLIGQAVNFRRIPKADDYVLLKSTDVEVLKRLAVSHDDVNLRNLAEYRLNQLKSAL